MNLKKKFSILTYNVGIITKGLDSVMESGLKEGDIRWLKHNYRDRFFADPFLFNEDDQFYYILVEELLFWEERGKITLLKVRKSNFSLVSRKIVIDEPFHMSFPFCEPGGDTITPEMSESGEARVYTINKDTFAIKNKKKIFDEGTIDAVFYSNSKGENLCLTGKTHLPSFELYMLKQKSDGAYEQVGDMIEYDHGSVRGAGRFFTWRGDLYRPVQDCNVRYGQQTKILKIKKLDSSGYEYETVTELNSFKNPPYDETFHTFNVYDNCIIVDGSKDFVRFPMKFVYRKMRFLFKKEK